MKMLEYFTMVMEDLFVERAKTFVTSLGITYSRYRERCHVITPNRRSSSPKRMQRQYLFIASVPIGQCLAHSRCSDFTFENTTNPSMLKISCVVLCRGPFIGQGQMAESG